jgi:hypothetical protein
MAQTSSPLTRRGCDPVQGLNEELAARDRALRRAALDRTIREAALATAQRDLEDAEAATQEAQHISDAERQQWTDQLRRLRNQEASRSHIVVNYDH